MNVIRKGCTALAVLGASMALAQPVLAQTNLSANMTVDNEFIAYISTDPDVLGTEIGSGLDWMVVDSFSTALTPGVTNYLHVIGNNLGGPAMFVGEFSLDTTGIFEFSNGGTTLLTDTANWMVGEVTPDMVPASLGVNDGSNATWGELVGIDQAAEFIWHPGGEGILAVVFQTAIAPVETDISITVDDMPDPVLAGSGSPNLTHTVTVTNTGAEATGVVVSLTDIQLPAGVTLDVWGESQGVFDGVDWAVGTLADAASATLTLELTVDYTAQSGDMVYAAFSLTALDQVDSDSSNDQDVSNPTTIEAATDVVTNFATSIDFLDDNMATVSATLTCNSGIPLTQSFDISEGSDVTFTVTELPFTTPGTTCEVTLAGLDAAYTLTPTSCLFDEPADFAVDGANTCDFVAAANAATYTVAKVWIIPDQGAEEEDYDVDVTITCDAEILSVGGVPGDGSMTAMVTLGDGESVDAMVDTVTGPAMCSATEDVTQSGVEAEASADCTDADLPAGGSATCTFTNTVFFEGIPTLSQYGLALLALLMLGMGFVSVRRFA